MLVKFDSVHIFHIVEIKGPYISIQLSIYFNIQYIQYTNVAY